MPYSVRAQHKDSVTVAYLLREALYNNPQAYNNPRLNGRNTALPINTSGNKANNNAENNRVKAMAGLRPAAIAASNFQEGGPVKNCFDTSVRLLFKKDSMWTGNDYITKTRDGNILIPGFKYFNTPHLYQGGHLIKCTPLGDTVWVKNLVTNFEGRYFSDVYRAAELDDGSIILTGNIDVPVAVNSRNDMLVVKLDKNGNLLWEKTFKVTAFGDDTAYNNIFVADIKQDSQGDIYMCGGLHKDGFPMYGMALKISGTGKLAWHCLYNLNYSAPVFGGINITGDTVTVTGHMLSGNYMPLYGIKLHKNTGDTLGYKCWQPITNNAYWYKFNASNLVKLNNGNLVVFGTAVADFGGFDSTQLITHYGMAEFTPSFDFVKSYFFRSYKAGNFYNTRIGVFPDGSAAYTRLDMVSNYSADVRYGAFNNGQITRERVIPYRGVGLAWVSNFLQADDGGQLITNFYGDSASGVTAGVELTRLHNSDTSNSCLGRDNYTTQVESLPFETADLQITGIYSNALTEANWPFVGVFDDTVDIVSSCRQVSYCDSMKVVAVNNAICPYTPATVHIRKNKGCGARPTWYFDTTHVASFAWVNDTTVKVSFNGPGTRYLRAELDGCSLLKDSVKLTVLQAPAVPSLGPDTVLCPGNKIVLNAHSGYSSYKWQDGSTDSIFTVTKPGKYYIDASNSCGDIFTDTVVVSGHPAIPFNLGNDLSVCERDTINITAPAGFLHYTWYPVYNIKGDSTQSASVYPSTTTMYHVTAEKTPGCFAEDSILVTVKPLPVLKLGNDTSFCAGQQIAIDAGSDFDSYAWNTGATSQAITANIAGVYAVQVEKNGCPAFDTLRVLNVFAIPAFTLGNDTTLCNGSRLDYHFNFPQALYVWSTGANTGNMAISAPGTYWLQVTQNNCRSADTITVAFTRAPVVNLGRDTTLCEGVSLVLNAYNDDAVYHWQDGATTSTYTVHRAGTYTVTATAYNCPVTASIVINYTPLPAFSLGADTFMCVGQQLILQPVVNTPVNYTWQNGSTAAAYTVNDPGVYSLKASNVCGTKTDSIVITSVTCKLLLPNAFTPNGDNLNDVFKIKYPFPAKQFTMVIYNRWGQKIYETADMTKGWDGRVNGINAPTGTYIWMVKLTDNDSKLQQQNGTVVLLR